MCMWVLYLTLDFKSTFKNSYYQFKVPLIPSVLSNYKLSTGYTCQKIKKKT